MNYSPVPTESPYSNLLDFSRPAKNTCCYAVIGSVVLTICVILFIGEYSYFNSGSQFGNKELMDAILISPIVPMLIASIIFLIIKFVSSATRIYVATAFAITVCAIPFLVFFAVIILGITAESFKVSTSNSTTTAQSILPAISLLYIISLAGTFLVCCTACIGLTCPNSFCCQDTPETVETGESHNYSSNSSGESIKLTPMSSISYI